MNMEKTYNILKILICILGSLIIIAFLILIVLNLFYEQDILTPYEKQYTKENEDMYVEQELITQWEKVKYKYQYYTVQTLVERYVTYIKDGIYDDTGIQEVSQEALYSIIDPTYLAEFHIENVEELMKKYEGFEKYEEITVNDIYVYQISNDMNLYFVRGYLNIAQKEITLFVKLDMHNSAFSIFPEEYLKKYEYTEQTQDMEQIANTYIVANNYNKFKMLSVSDERMTVIYFNQLKTTILTDASKGYEYLDTEYREKRFGSEENYEAYLNKNKTELAQIEISSYLSNHYKDYNEYVCKDQYNNIYIFKETAVNEYTVQLDDYTLSDEELDAEYMKLSTQEKVANNVNKWVKMLNNRDYQAAFNVLDETFRTTNFENNVDKFEEYIRQELPQRYQFELKEYSNETGISIQKILMEDMTGTDATKIEKSIYMQLGENTDFVMSFDVK